jgi:hypothetical protein
VTFIGISVARIAWEVVHFALLADALLQRIVAKNRRCRILLVAVRF